MVTLMNRPTQQKRGQAIVEYLVVAAAVIVALIAVASVVGTKTQQVLTDAVNDIP